MLENSLSFCLSSVTKASARSAFECHQKGYGEIIIPESEYWADTRINTSRIAFLKEGNRIAGAANLNIHPERSREARIIAISIDPLFQNRGLGVELLQDIQAVYPNVWITVSLTQRSKAMLKTVLNAGFGLVQSRGEIEHRFTDLPGVYGDNRVFMTTEGIEGGDFYDKLLSRQGIAAPPTFYRPGCRHEYPYPQVLAAA